MINDTKYGLYYECHITIEPLFSEEERNSASTIAKKYSFKLANLLMQKDRLEKPTRSNKDTFMTSHSTCLSDITCRMNQCISSLKSAGFTVWRAKIEDTVIDIKFNRS